jgi:hypothetical protein
MIRALDRRASSLRGRHCAGGPIGVLRIAESKRKHGIGQFPPVAITRMDADENRPVAVRFYVTCVKCHFGKSRGCKIQGKWDLTFTPALAARGRLRIRGFARWLPSIQNLFR